jgi:hypothetical protein
MSSTHNIQNEFGGGNHEIVDGCNVVEFTPSDCPFCRAERAEVLLRRCAIELSYVASVENCGSGLCASSEGAACIEAAEKLLGPMRQWPELRGEEKSAP